MYSDQFAYVDSTLQRPLTRAKSRPRPSSAKRLGAAAEAVVAAVWLQISEDPSKARLYLRLAWCAMARVVLLVVSGSRLGRRGVDQPGRCRVRQSAIVRAR